MKLIVFDLDDTLYLERDYVRSGFNAVGDHLRQHYNVTGADTILWSEFLAGTRGNTFNVAAQKLGFPGEIIPELVDVYRHHRPEINLQADARKALRAASDTAATALVTDGYAPGQRRKIEALNVAAYLNEIVVTAEHGEHWHKPGEKSFCYLQNHFDANPEECIYIADNPRKDFIAPLALGWRTARIRRPQGIYSDVTADRPALTPEWGRFTPDCLAYVLNCPPTG